MKPSPRNRTLRTLTAGLTRFATVDNEHELLELALTTTANHLPRALAA